MLRYFPLIILMFLITKCNVLTDVLSALKGLHYYKIALFS